MLCRVIDMDNCVDHHQSLTALFPRAGQAGNFNGRVCLKQSTLRCLKSDSSGEAKIDNSDKTSGLNDE